MTGFKFTFVLKNQIKSNQIKLQEYTKYSYGKVLRNTVYFTGFEICGNFTIKVVRIILTTTGRNFL